MNYFANYYTNKAIVAFVFVLITSIVFFGGNILPLHWIIFSVLTVILFFKYLSKLSRTWAGLSIKRFRRKLFWTAFILRIIAVLFLYFLFDYMTGQPYEFGAADSLFYNDMGNLISDFILNGEFNLFDKLWYIGVSDKGYPILLGILYTIFFKSVLLSRMMNALVGARVTILVYDITKRNFDENTARLAGIMTMLLPNFLYYAGLSLKESFLLYIVIAFINYADELLRQRTIKPTLIILILVLGIALFYFRTVLAISLILSFIVSLILLSNKISGVRKRIFIIFWFVIGVIILISSKSITETNIYLENSDSNQRVQMKHFAERLGGNKLARYGSRSIFLPIILFAPFPTFVDTQQNNLEMLSGAFFIRNIYAFFVVLALYFMFRRKLLRQHILIISVVFSYLLILASSGFALSERFHLPVVPLLIILASYGITHMKNKHKRYFVPYLIIISIVIIGWNWFKLAGRGLM